VTGALLVVKQNSSTTSDHPITAIPWYKPLRALASTELNDDIQTTLALTKMPTPRAMAV